MDTFLSLSHTVVMFVAVFSVLVFVHEWGHYIVARMNGVRIEVFSIGFGPEIFGWTDKAKTRWKVSYVPLGGYVKFFGDVGAASIPSEESRSMAADERAVSFPHKKPIQRFAIVAAGPIANFVFAIIILAGFFMIVGQPYTPAEVGEIMAESAAEEAGFEVGDKIVRIDNTRINRFLDMQQIVSLSPDEQMRFTVERGGELVTLAVRPERVEFTDNFGQTHEIGRLGISRTAEDYIKRNPASAVWYATVETGTIVRLSLKFIGQIITGKRSGEDLGGPIRIAKFSGDTAKQGLAALIWFTALLSINLGFINLLPIPMLDGGHLVYYGWEIVTGKPLGARIQEYGFRIGLAMVLTLMVFVTWNDLMFLNIFDF
ncbi:MAG: RIP metalloprotease RseP [Sphingomonadales bacterium]